MDKSNFSDSEWQTLQFTPLWAFYGVAGIDGKLDEKEAGVISKELAESMLYKNPFTREVLTSIATNIKAIMPAFADDNRQALSGLSEAADILDSKVDKTDADDFKKTVLVICRDTAQASGPIFGDKISMDEKKALIAVAAALRVQL